MQSPLKPKDFCSEISSGTMGDNTRKEVWGA